MARVLCVSTLVPSLSRVLSISKAHTFSHRTQSITCVWWGVFDCVWVIFIFVSCIWIVVSQCEKCVCDEKRKTNGQTNEWAEWNEMKWTNWFCTVWALYTVCNEFINFSSYYREFHVFCMLCLCSTSPPLSVSHSIYRFLCIYTCTSRISHEERVGEWKRENFFGVFGVINFARATPKKNRATNSINRN